jgi:DNA-binding response OmpR family regulator
MRDKAILLVDDERPILESLGNYLERNYYNVRTVTSGKAALAEFCSTRFDMVITDLAMEGISGLEVLKAIKEINHNTCVIILTGQGDMVKAIEALRFGADDFLLKPCDVDELVVKMEHFFERQEALQRIQFRGKYLPICMYCKKIRDDDSSLESGREDWLRLDEFLRRNSGIELTHGCCPECFHGHAGDWLR